MSPEGQGPEPRKEPSPEARRIASETAARIIEQVMARGIPGEGGKELSRDNFAGYARVRLDVVGESSPEVTFMQDQPAGISLTKRQENGKFVEDGYGIDPRGKVEHYQLEGETVDISAADALMHSRDLPEEELTTFQQTVSQVLDELEQE